MSLLKLSEKKEILFDPIQKASEIIGQFENFNLIQNAYVFGSAAESKMTSDSDLDLFLTFNSIENLITSRKEIIHSKQNIAIDWIFKTQADFEKEKNFGGVSYEAYHFGKKIK